MNYNFSQSAAKTGSILSWPTTHSS